MRRLGLLLAALPLGLSVCSARAEGPAADGPKYSIPFAYKPGQRLLLVSETHGEKTHAHFGQIKSDSKFELLLTAGRAKDDAAVDILLNVRRMRIEARLGRSGRFVCDTDLPVEPLSAGFRDAQFEAKIEPDGKVASFTGGERVLEKDPGAPRDPQEKQLVVSSINGVFRHEMIEPLAYLPARPVAVGEAWQASRLHTSAAIDLLRPDQGGREAFEATESVTCRLVAVREAEEGKLATIGFEGKLKVSVGGKEQYTSDVSGGVSYNIDTGEFIKLTWRLEGAALKVARTVTLRPFALITGRKFRITDFCKDPGKLLLASSMGELQTEGYGSGRRAMLHLEMPLTVTRPGGNKAEVLMAVRRVRFEFGVPGRPTYAELDTDRPGQTSEKGFSELLHAKFEAELDKDGRIISFSGGRELAERTAKTAEAETKDKTSRRLNEWFQGMLADAVVYLPGGPVAPGDSWKVTRDVTIFPILPWAPEALDVPPAKEEIACKLTEISETDGVRVATIAITGTARVIGEKEERSCAVRGHIRYNLDEGMLTELTWIARAAGEPRVLVRTVHLRTLEPPATQPAGSATEQ
ncbi:MAG: DUF6263 family protein [Planctomycetota bacterium]|jgi:hypothetical protein